MVILTATYAAHLQNAEKLLCASPTKRDLQLEYAKTCCEEARMYHIQIDEPNELVQVELGGLMPVDEVAAYIAELKRQIVAHRLRSYAMVIDVSRCPIQSQDMTRSMAEHMAEMPKARSLAIVTNSALARMQVRRLFAQPYARIAATVAEGREWVLNGTEPRTL
jgi:hypothetical protein